VTGTRISAKAEVTRGGVDTTRSYRRRAWNLATVPGLHFIAKCSTSPVGMWGGY